MTNRNEFNFSEPAKLFLEGIIGHFRTRGMDEFQVGGVSIFETNTSPLMLYYLQKAFKYIARDGAEVVLKPKPEKKAFFFRTAWFAREFLLSIRNACRDSVVESGDILFVCNVVRQYDSIAPLVRELLKEGDFKISILTKIEIPENQKVLSKRIRYLSWNRLRNLEFFSRLSSQVRKMERKWHQENKEGNFANPYLSSVLGQWFSSMGFQALRALLMAQRVLEAIRPRIIVVTDASDHEAKSFTLIGKGMKIPSLCLQYGLAYQLSSEWRFFSQDYVAAIDQPNAEIIRKLGVPSERVLASGNPRFDRFSNDPELRRLIRKRLRIQEDQRLIFFASIPYVQEGIGHIDSSLTEMEYRNILEWIYKIPRLNTDCVLVVKPHPEENLSWHRHFVRKSLDVGQRIRLVTEYNSYEIANASDLVATLYSTISLEAIYLDKPLITMIVPGRDDMTHMDHMISCGAATPVRSEEELILAIRDLLDNRLIAERHQKARQNYIKNNFDDGFSSNAERCAKVVIELSKGIM